MLTCWEKNSSLTIHELFMLMPLFDKEYFIKWHIKSLEPRMSLQSKNDYEFIIFYHKIKKKMFELLLYLQ